MPSSQPTRKARIRSSVRQSLAHIVFRSPMAHPSQGLSTTATCENNTLSFFPFINTQQLCIRDWKEINSRPMKAISCATLSYIILAPMEAKSPQARPKATFARPSRPVAVPPTLMGTQGPYVQDQRCLPLVISLGSYHRTEYKSISNANIRASR